MNSTIRFAFLAFLLLASSFDSQAQSNSRSAQLSGQLTDASGYGIASARVLATREEPNSSQTYQTTSVVGGNYFLSLPPGTYRVRFERNDFVPRDLPLQLAPAESRKVDVRLEIAQLSENVVVTANAQPLELSQTPAPVDVIAREEIDQRQLVSLPDALATVPGAA
ncbi:MAG: hypothetical protein JWO71_946, partial [Candidatus Acidoferrum typicum]|nr:hypothetical protein [Candidatus Acidoferrum typicum]